MKLSNFFKSIALGSILVFSFGCGKDNKSGGYGSFTNLYQDGNSDPNSRYVLEQLNQWYNSNRDASSYQYPDGLYKIEKVKFTQTGSTGGALPPGCKEEKVWIFTMVVCSGGSTPGATTSGEVVSTITTDVRSNDGVVINRKNNEALRNVLSGASGRLVSARSAGSGSFELIFVSSDSSRISSYVINTSFNSAFNPISQTVRNVSTGVVEQIGTRAQLLQIYNGNNPYPY